MGEKRKGHAGRITYIITFKEKDIMNTIC